MSCREGHLYLGVCHDQLLESGEGAVGWDLVLACRTHDRPDLKPQKVDSCDHLKAFLNRGESSRTVLSIYALCP